MSSGRQHRSHASISVSVPGETQIVGRPAKAAGLEARAAVNGHLVIPSFHGWPFTRTNECSHGDPFRHPERSVAQGRIY